MGTIQRGHGHWKTLFLGATVYTECHRIKKNKENIIFTLCTFSPDFDWKHENFRPYLYTDDTVYYRLSAT